MVLATVVASSAPMIYSAQLNGNIMIAMAQQLEVEKAEEQYQTQVLDHNTVLCLQFHD